jgi:serine/threonine kinase 38
VIGKGAFGEVRLCKWVKNGEPVAVKKLKKSEMIFKNKVVQSREERNVLAIADNNPWVVGLKCSFQDAENLYLVMEYLPGGDLMNLLIKKDIFTHEEAQLYTAEILMALDSVHNMKYIHRDLKPDNVLLDASGHIKLSDFGLCKHTEIRPKRLIDSITKK